MNKSITSAVIISVMCSVPFILGFVFNEAYQTEKKKLVTTTITEYSGVQELFGWYSLIIADELALKDLNTVKTIKDVEYLKQKARDHGSMHIRLFRDKIKKIRKKAVNPEALDELEKSVNEIEDAFN